jgi:hypothetical protein
MRQLSAALPAWGAHIRDAHVPGLFVAERQVVAAQTKLNRISERGAADDFNFGAVAEPHLKKAAAKLGIASDGGDAALTANAHLIEAARFEGSRMIAGRKVTGFFHKSRLQRT